MWVAAGRRRVLSEKPKTRDEEEVSQMQFEVLHRKAWVDTQQGDPIDMILGYLLRLASPACPHPPAPAPLSSASLLRLKPVTRNVPTPPPRLIPAPHSMLLLHCTCHDMS